LCSWGIFDLAPPSSFRNPGASCTKIEFLKACWRIGHKQAIAGEKHRIVPDIGGIQVVLIDPLKPACTREKKINQIITIVRK
jgi:hypothetical protein